MQHLVLLGDSIFDNGSYVGSEPDVATHLRQLAPSDWKVTLCAVDGDTTADVVGQLRNVPENVSHLFLSVGGNDALSHAHLLSDTTTPALQILSYLEQASGNFESDYRKLIEEMLHLRSPLTVLTIYNGNLRAPIDNAARAAVAIFNDKIYQVAGVHSLPVLELRRICCEPSDYANPIEPSSRGERKIAVSILRQVQASFE